MPKLTAKYRTALDKCIISIPAFNPRTSQDQETIYKILTKAGYQWDSKHQEWVNLEEELADEATKDIMVRCWADAEIVEEIADLVEKAIKKYGYARANRSDVYPCRPPKQLEGRIYLTFRRG